MAEDIEELVVRARPEGIDETSDELEGLEDQFGGTAEELDDTAGEMEGLSSRWQGALTAIMAGLAVAVGGLLSQVPILGELMSGLGAIIEAVAFQIDQLLRPVLTPLTNALFDISAAVFEADGALGDLVGILGIVGSVVTAAIASYLGFIAASEGLGAVVTTIVGGFKSFVTILTDAVIAVGSWLTTTLAGAALIGAAIGLVVVKLGTMIGAFERIMSLGGRFNELIGSQMVNRMLAAISVISLGLIPLLAALGAAFVELVQGDFQGAITSFNEVLSVFADSIKSTFREVLQIIRQVLSAIQGATSDVPILGDIIQGATGGGGGGAGGTSGAMGAAGGLIEGVTSTTQLFIDGRQAEAGTRRHRDDETNRRGRFG